MVKEICNEKLHSSFSSPSVFRAIKSKRMDRLVVLMKETSTAGDILIRIYYKKEPLLGTEE
jgi:hypothetical protein